MLTVHKHVTWSTPAAGRLARDQEHACDWHDPGSP